MSLYNSSLAYNDNIDRSEDLSRVWKFCISYLESLIGKKQLDTWINPIVPLRLEGKTLTIGVPTLFFAERIEESFAVAFSQTLSKVLGSGARLRYEVNIDSTAKDGISGSINVQSNSIYGKILQLSENREISNLGNEAHLVQGYTFERFVASMSNDTARSLALRICEIQGDSSINPFFIYGAPGVGKTHLINAIGWQILKKKSQLRVLYISADNFIQQFTGASCNHKTADFTKYYRNIDVLLIDDIQSLIGKAKTQTAFFQIFNHLYLLKRQIVFTCDKPPYELHGMEERLLSRITGSCITYIDRPDEALRREILERKMDENGIKLSKDVVAYIVKNVTTSLRELEGILNTLMVNSLVSKQEITLQFAQETISRIIKQEYTDVSAECIFREIACHLNISLENIRSRSRKQEYVLARQIVMYILKKHTDESYVAIGRMLGNRAHTTVVHGCETIKEQLKVNSIIRDTVDSIESKLMLKKTKEYQ